MSSHLWRRRREEIASDPELRAASEREMKRMVRGTRKMRLEVMILRANCRLAAMHVETFKALARKRRGY